MSSSGFETTEPRGRLIAALGGGIVILLVLMVVGVQAYYDHVLEQQVFVKQLQPVSEDLQALRAREDNDLHAYRYVDRAKGTVRLPIDRAMELVIQEAHEKK